MDPERRKVVQDVLCDRLSVAIKMYQLKSNPANVRILRERATAAIRVRNQMFHGGRVQVDTPNVKRIVELYKSGITVPEIVSGVRV